MKTILAKIKTGSQTVRLAGQQNNNNHLGKSVFIRVHLWLKLNRSGLVGGRSDSQPVSGAETRCPVLIITLKIHSLNAFDVKSTDPDVPSSF